MALAFYVDGPDSIAKAFAAHDEYTAVFTYYVRGKNPKCRMLTPDEDNYYSAPFCFLPKYQQQQQQHHQNNGGGGGAGGGSSSSSSSSGYLVFTSQVPWLHGNPRSDRSDRAHYQAEEWMKERGRLDPPYIGSVEEFQAKMGLREMDVHTFTIDGCYPTCDEISQALEDRAVEVTCSVMGWRMPQNWRALRRKMTDLHSIPILNLAEWDQHRRQRRMRDNGNVSNNDDKDDDDGRSATGGGDAANVDDVDDDAHGEGRNNETTTRNEDDAKVVPSDHRDDTNNDDEYDRQEEKKDCSTEEQRRHRRC
ncbi:hypothetical protein ACHAXA_011764 [Cyclostephanos tholiformis]|uniref:Uncharacterized protein n=1 Tax=Cyclostephanos tholiformis TaxID=382380 RepID=A0ABD3RXN5_9STRA